MEVAMLSPSTTCQGPNLKTNTITSQGSSPSLIYHIYHVGTEKHPRNYSIHTIKDSDTTILAPLKPAKSKKRSKSRKSSTTLALQASNPFQDSAQVVPVDTSNTTSSRDADSRSPLQTIQTSGANLTDSATLTPTNSRPLKGIKKAKLLDNPKHDPRSLTAPYFVHLPRLAFHEPPYTLRRAGHKRGPVACLMYAKPFWMGWKLEFGDVLEREGVIDGRGVVNARFGTKNGKWEGETGYLKGFKTTKRRWWGESGKKYWEEQKENGFLDNQHMSEERVKPEEIIRLKWISPFGIRTRDHEFEWRGHKFLWKGTKQVTEVRPSAKAFVWCGHLKLVVLLPVKERVGDEFRPPPEELCLARYECTLGNRKAGKLEIFQDTIDAFLSQYVTKDEPTEAGSTAISTSSSATAVIDPASTTLTEDPAKTQQRLRDIMFSTALCMLMSERDKRRLLLELLQQIGEYAGG